MTVSATGMPQRMGIMTGAACSGMGVGGSVAVRTLEGALGSAASQWILNGAIKLDQVFMDGAFSGLFEFGRLNLKSNTTEYEVWHELSHYIQYQQIGPEAYANLPRTVGVDFDLNNFNAPEQFVYDMLNNNPRRWSLLSPAEQAHANSYITNFGGVR